MGQNVTYRKKMKRQRLYQKRRKERIRAARVAAQHQKKKP